MHRRWVTFLLLLITAMAHATTPSSSFSVTYTCTGDTGPYQFTFPISDATALSVTQNGVLLAPSAYSVMPTNNSFANGGAVTLNNMCESGTLVLKRVTPVTQGSVFQDNMPQPMKTFEQGLDKLTQIAQEQGKTLQDQGTVVTSKASPGSCPLNTPYVTSTTTGGVNCIGSSSSSYPGVTSNGTGLNSTGSVVVTGSGNVAVGSTDPTQLDSSKNLVLGGTGDVKASSCRPLRGTINVLDCGITGTGDETAKLLTAIKNGKTYNADVLINTVVSVCNLPLSSLTDAVHVHGPIFGSPGIIKMYNPCASGILIDGVTNSTRRTMEWDHLTFDLNSIGKNVFKNSFAIQFSIHDNSFIGCAPGAGNQGTGQATSSIYIWDDLSEYPWYERNYYSGSKCYAHYGTNVNHGRSTNEFFYTSGGIGSIWGFNFIFEHPDIELNFNYPWSSQNATLEMTGGRNTFNHAYVETTGNSACGISAASITSGVETIVTNSACFHSLSFIQPGNFVSVSATRTTADINNAILTTNSTAPGTSTPGTATVTFPTAAGDMVMTTYSLAGATSCASNFCTVTLNALPANLSRRDWISFSGTSSCLDGNAYQIGSIQVSAAAPNTLRFAAGACSTAAATGTASFGYITGPYIGNPTVVYSLATLDAVGNYINGQASGGGGNTGLTGFAASNGSSFMGNYFTNVDMPIKIASGLGSTHSGNMGLGNQNNFFNQTDYGQIGLMTLNNGGDNGPQSLWAASNLNPSFEQVGHRTLIGYSTINQCANNSTNSLGTVDLLFCNIQSFNNSGPTTINTIYNLKDGPAKNVVMPGTFVFSGANTNTTFANSVFNNCSGADFNLTTNRPVPYVVGNDGVMREVGCNSALLGKAAGSLWYSDGTKPVPVAITGLVKAGAGAPTAAVSGTDYAPGSATPLTGTTGSIGGGALTAGTCSSGTATVTGATTSMDAHATPTTYPGDAFDWKAYVSSSNTVTVKICTNLAAGGTPTASTYNVRVTQ